MVSVRAGTGRPIFASLARETDFMTRSAVAMATPTQTQPVTSSSTANSEELTAFPGFDQFHSHSCRSTTKK